MYLRSTLWWSFVASDVPSGLAAEALEGDGRVSRCPTCVILDHDATGNPPRHSQLSVSELYLYFAAILHILRPLLITS